MQVAYTQEGLEAIIFTSDGDMRQALNNLQVPLPPPPPHAHVKSDRNLIDLQQCQDCKL